MGISLNTIGGSLVDPLSPFLHETPEGNPEAKELFEHAEECDKNKNYSTASEGYQKAADLGYTEAMVKLGDYFMIGRGMWKDPAKAADWYEKAAKLGNPEAMTKFGLCCERGEGVAKDTNKAVDWYQRAADQKHPEGLYRLARAYQANKGNPRGPGDEVETLLERSAELQFPAACGELGRVYISSSQIFQNEERESRMKKGVDLLRKGVALGDVEAMKSLAWCYQYGCIGAEKNIDTFIELMQKAALCNDLCAIRWLGCCYEEQSEEIRQDFKKAAELWERGDSLSDAFSTLKLGRCFRLGEGVPQNLPRAANLYQKALVLDPLCTEAMTELGYMFLGGIGVQKDRRHAVRFLRVAADRCALS